MNALLLHCIIDQIQTTLCADNWLISNDWKSAIIQSRWQNCTEKYRFAAECSSASQSILNLTAQTRALTLCNETCTDMQHSSPFYVSVRGPNYFVVQLSAETRDKPNFSSTSTTHGPGAWPLELRSLLLSDCLAICTALYPTLLFAISR